jgi:Protein of unknown function (DUF3800)
MRGQILNMFTAYVDDSNMTAKPVAMLGGWVGKAPDWISFTDSWADALWMKPRLRYFKLMEAQNLTGEFGGWTEQSRTEQMRLLVKTIEHFGFLGITCAWPQDVYQEVFRNLPDRGLNNPYFLAFFDIVAMLCRYFQRKGETDKINFVFDIQPGKIEIVTLAWEKFLEVAPEVVRPLVGDYPIFRDDKTTLPLQAADLAVGNSRRFAEAHYYGREPEPALWGNLELNIQVLGRYWTKEMMLELRSTWNF